MAERKMIKNASETKGKRGNNASKRRAEKAFKKKRKRGRMHLKEKKGKRGRNAFKKERKEEN